MVNKGIKAVRVLSRYYSLGRKLLIWGGVVPIGNLCVLMITSKPLFTLTHFNSAHFRYWVACGHSLSGFNPGRVNPHAMGGFESRLNLD